MNYYFHVLGKYAVFNGRASRKEFWLFWLVHLIISVALALYEGFYNLFPESNESILTSVYALAVLLPTFAVGARRLHDTGRTGWWQLIAFIPLVGAIVLIIFCQQDGESGANYYGPDPKGRNRTKTKSEDEFKAQDDGSQKQSTANFGGGKQVKEHPETASSDQGKENRQEAIQSEPESPLSMPSLIKLNDDELYALAWREVDGGNRAEGLWARLFVEHAGDDTKTRVAYLKLRVEELHKLRAAEIEELEKEEQARMGAQRKQLEAETEAKRLELEKKARQKQKEEEEAARKRKEQQEEEEEFERILEQLPIAWANGAHGDEGPPYFLKPNAGENLQSARQAIYDGNEDKLFEHLAWGFDPDIILSSKNPDVHKALEQYPNIERILTLTSHSLSKDQLEEINHRGAEIAESRRANQYEIDETKSDEEIEEYLLERLAAVDRFNSWEMTDVANNRTQLLAAVKNRDQKSILRWIKSGIDLKIVLRSADKDVEKVLENSPAIKQIFDASERLKDKGIDLPR